MTSLIRPGARRAALLLCAAALLGGPATSTALASGPAPVPCTQSSSSPQHYDCDFYPAGDGFSAGAPVQAPDSSTVGYLNQGTNWVVCQRQGGTVASGPYENNWWAWTEANDGRWGWVNAVWARGGDNFGSYASVPACADSVGLPPGAQPPPASGASTVSAPAAPAAPTAPAPPSPPSSGRSRPAARPLRHQRVRIAVDWSEQEFLTRVTGLHFRRLPRHARISARCRRGCRFALSAVTAPALRHSLLRQAFSGGEVLRLTIRAPGYRPLIVDLRFRANDGPAGRLVSR